jgi:dTDP-glucose 4,6-dehydratase
MTKVICVTGGLGFIGKSVVRRLTGRGDYVYLIDAETYAADKSFLYDDSMLDTESDLRLKYIKSDICDFKHLPNVDAIINLAAETHVDNSIMDNAKFYHSNVEGVRNLLELCRAKRNYEIPLFVQISTDEVYGDVLQGSTDENAPLAPSSPYAATKAAADLLIQAWGRSYGVPWRIVRPSNCYGTGQYPEKLIPKAVRCLSLGKPIPIHEGGNAVRQWLWVEDCADAILTVLDKGHDNHIYNVPGNAERSVLQVARQIVHAFNGDDNVSAMEYIERGYTRMGLDKRYCVSGFPLGDLGWQPVGDFDKDLPKIVEVERSNFRW